MEQKTELTISHLVSYFTYGLMAHDDYNNEVVLITGINKEYIYIKDRSFSRDYTEIKPILRTLDLNKEITHKGETFIPKRKLTDLGIADVYEFEFNGMDFIYEHETDFVSDGYGNEFHTIWIPMENQYKIYQKCFEWMFDMGGLIAQGLAIDVDLLEDNPYK